VCSGHEVSGAGGGEMGGTGSGADIVV
jgi:hypothetical protein